MNTLTGCKIVSVQRMSFILNEELQCTCIAFLIQTGDHKWHQLTLSDGKAGITSQAKTPDAEEIGDSIFSYPVTFFSIDEMYTRSSINSVQEYLWQGRKDETCGFLIGFENGAEFSLIDHDDCMKFLDGLDHQLLENCVLSDFE
ncbi:hypothetical protein [Taibaiella chishuiensis]|uniref:Uncharacterized protein n=1 Tax=Taibaiella chishuiensis TaxID=1434707 RepID=A0A2P8D7C9_9BACT|nr:hypothetical protein [Taibaiella chishuiensis]PSK93112.1 hypothetical protein B0I18_10281 [Taibaiella chishuiensis]